MFRELLFPLVKHFSVFNIFQYITFRAAYAAITALLISFMFGPKLIAWLQKKKAGQEIREDGPRSHLKKSGTPTMGGILINFSIAVSVFLWQDIRNVYTWIAILAIIGFGLIGFLDDYLKVFKKNSAGMKAKFKLFAQTGLSIVIVMLIYMNQNDHRSEEHTSELQSH